MVKNNLKLETYEENTWCPGCGNFGILTALKQAVSSLVEKGIPQENIVIVSGIGCHAKIVDYLNLNSFYCLHGRPVATAQGIKLANPNLKVIVCAGDGDSYDEGISHLIHAAKRNIDITVLVHDNRNFALTTGQFTPTSPEGYIGKSTPRGSIEEPFDPLKIMLASKATFIAQGYSARINHLKNLIVQGISHRGFSFIDILQPCVTFTPKAYQFYNKRVFEVKSENLASEEKALRKINQWKYGKKGTKIPIGIFYKTQRPCFEKRLLKSLNPSKRKRKEDWTKKEIKI